MSAKPCLKSLYYDMLLIRRFEERAAQAYGLGKIGGFCHLCIGQEAVVVGACRALQAQDSLITAYRDHGHMLACGMDPKEIMAELFGKSTGSSLGKGGSMHMFSREKNFFGGHGIVGAQVSLGTGLAFAHQYKKDQGLCAVFLGDGASNQGQVYESFNMAALWGLPALYIIENNGYAMGTSVKRSCAGELYKRGEAYGIPGTVVDGMDVLTVYAAIEKAAKQVRKGKPVLLEMRTYRYRGHSMSDPGHYREKGEIDQYRQKDDPLLNALKALEGDEGYDAWKAQCEKDVKDIVKESMDFAHSSPLPDAEALYTHVYQQEITP